MVRASQKVWAKKNTPRASASFQKAWLDRAELLKTCGSRAKFRAEPRLDTALLISKKVQGREGALVIVKKFSY